MEKEELNIGRRKAIGNLGLSVAALAIPNIASAHAEGNATSCIGKPYR